MKKNKEYNKTIKNRLNFISSLVIVLFCIILVQLCKLIIIDGSIYKEKLKDISTTILLGESSPRGRIYDRNHVLLVDNKSVPVIVYKKQNKVTVSDELNLAYKMSKVLDIDYSSINLIDLKEFWMAKYPDLANKKITEEEWIKLKNRKLNLEDIKYLKIDRITEEELKKFKAIDKESAYIYYLMNKGYSYDEKVIKGDNISDKEYAYIAEHASELNGFNVSYRWERVYLYNDTFRSIFGNISSITSENKDYYISKGYSLDDLVGVSYLEKQYEDVLRGTKAKYKLESNNLVLVQEGKRGNDIVLTIDIKLQQEVEKILKEQVLKTKSEPSTEYYNRSYVIIQEPNTGEILAMSGKQVIKKKNKYEVYDVTSDVITNPITAGSVVKGASILVGYNTNAIKIGEYMNDNCIKIYMNPRKCSWKTLGRINDLQALAYSSNIYQFKTAMKVDGFNYSYNKKYTAKESTFDLYRNMYNQFGLGVKTEIDLPVESTGYKGTKTNSDLLLNFTIGQYDTYTPMQLSQYITTIASDGYRYKTHLLKEVYESTNDIKLGNLKESIEPTLLNVVETKKEYLQRVKKGFRGVLTYGIANGIMGKSPTPSGKTGTSESFIDTNGDGIIDTETISSLFVGYAPTKNPVMSILVASPDLVNPNSKTSLQSYANNRITRLISNKYFQLYNNN